MRTGKTRTRMKWIEVIQLRSLNRNRKSLSSKLKRLIREVEKENKGQSVKIYGREMIDTDFSIVLFNHAEKEQKGGSALGLGLADALKEFGMVRHTIWLEMESET